MEILQIEKTIEQSGKLYTLFLKSSKSIYLVNSEFFLLYTDPKKAFEYANDPKRASIVEIIEIENKTEFFTSATASGVVKFLMDGEGDIISLSDFSQKFYSAKKTADIAEWCKKQNSSVITENAADTSDTPIFHDEDTLETKDPFNQEIVSHTVKVSQPPSSIDLSGILFNIRKVLLILFAVFSLSIFISSLSDTDSTLSMLVMFLLMTAALLFMAFSKFKFLWLLLPASVFFGTAIESLIVDNDTGTAIVLLIIGVIFIIPILYINKKKHN